MNEDVLTFRSDDEAEALAGIEPLHLTFNVLERAVRHVDSGSVLIAPYAPTTHTEAGV